jgi:hypothetical protein
LRNESLDDAHKLPALGVLAAELADVLETALARFTVLVAAEHVG